MTSCLILARHGETEWNRQGRLQGREDSPLTPEGVAHAGCLADFAHAAQVGRLLASPLGRARSTAAIVGDRLGCVVELRDELKEIDFGQCAGVTQAEAYRRFPALESARRRDKWGHPWPGGESYAQASLRVAALLTELQEVANCERSTLIVAHQSINRVLVHCLTGLDPACVLESDQPSRYVMRVEASGHISHAILPDVSWREGLPRSSGPRPPAFPTSPEWGRSVAR